MDNIVTIGSNSQAEPLAGQRSAGAPADGLQVTPSAINRIRVVLAKEGISTEEGGLRLGVKGGGCSGLSYSITTDRQPRERDHIFAFEDVRVFIDPKSFVYLKDMTLDYEETLIRQGFNFLNPNSKRACGCGSSFSV